MKKVMLVIVVLLFAISCYGSADREQQSRDLIDLRNEATRDYKSGKISRETYHEIMDEIRQRQTLLMNQMNYPSTQGESALTTLEKRQPIDQR